MHIPNVPSKCRGTNSWSWPSSSSPPSGTTRKVKHQILSLAHTTIRLTPQNSSTRHKPERQAVRPGRNPTGPRHPQVRHQRGQSVHRRSLLLRLQQRFRQAARRMPSLHQDHRTADLLFRPPRGVGVQVTRLYLQGLSLCGGVQAQVPLSGGLR